MVRQEYNLPLTKEVYEHLREKVDGRLIVKTRYEIPLDDRHKIELDIFHGDLAPLILAEVEFADEDEANQFTPPEWFGEDVTFSSRYHNSNLSKCKNRAVINHSPLLYHYYYSCPANPSCTAFNAFSTSFLSTSTVIRISDVAIILMLILAL